MKTIKTSSWLKKINDTSADFVSLQLRILLQEHRSSLIDKMVNGELDGYIAYKFNSRITGKRLQQIAYKLTELKNSGIDVILYQPIFQAVLKHEYTNIGNAMFYEEIDKTIKACLLQPDLFNGVSEGRKSFFN